MKIYLAGGIFYLGDKFRNDYFFEKLTEAFPTADIYDPLQNTDINGVEGKKKFAGQAEEDADQYFCSCLLKFFEKAVLPKKFRYLEKIPADSQGKKKKSEIQGLFSAKNAKKTE